MKPYYEQDNISIYHGDCRDVLPTLGTFDLLLTDPPYGINADKHQAQRANRQDGKAAAPSRDYGRTEWDTTAPDGPTLTLARMRCRNSIIWGGNYFTLPPMRGWLVWDKCNGDNGYADCELAWSDLDTAVRLIQFRWMGMLQDDMGNKEYRCHPTQKPEAVMRWCLSLAPKTVKTVLHPFVGSGTTLVAAKRIGLSAVGIEAHEKYCEEAANRLRQGVLTELWQ